MDATQTEHRGNSHSSRWQNAYQTVRSTDCKILVVCIVMLSTEFENKKGGSSSLSSLTLAVLVHPAIGWRRRANADRGHVTIYAAYTMPHVRRSRWHGVAFLRARWAEPQCCLYPHLLLKQSTSTPQLRRCIGSYSI